MTLWMVRAGRNGEREELALERGVVVIGWSQLPDLGQATSIQDVEALLRETNPSDNPRAIINWSRQIWTFAKRMQVGDLVALPLKSRAAIAIGRVAGQYAHHPDWPDDAQHTRKVEWLRTDIPRSSIGQDLLYSFGAFLTVCEISRNDAEARIRGILSTGKDPGLKPTGKTHGGGDSTDGGTELPIDLEQYARDQITAHLTTHFKGHELASLVAALLRADGYSVFTSPAGADGGVDIVAGRGTMGFDPPRLCVQVKSSEGPVSVSVLRELKGIMPSFGADAGLLVAWGGFKDTVRAEARKDYFQIRLWDAGDLVNALLASYDRLDDETKAELPLKRIWTLVQGEE